jgi:hypothetical protein
MTPNRIAAGIAVAIEVFGGALALLGAVSAVYAWFVPDTTGCIDCRGMALGSGIVILVMFVPVWLAGRAIRRAVQRAAKQQAES